MQLLAACLRLLPVDEFWSSKKESFVLVGLGGFPFGVSGVRTGRELFLPADPALKRRASIGRPSGTSLHSFCASRWGGALRLSTPVEHSRENLVDIP